MTRITIPMLTRAENLRAVGLSYTAIAAVLSLDYGRPVKAWTVREHLVKRGEPRDLRRVTNSNLINLNQGSAA